METSPLVCSANQWTSFYMKKTSVMKELMQNCTSLKAFTKFKVLLHSFVVIAAIGVKEPYSDIKPIVY